jgi:hypothetical protein
LWLKGAKNGVMAVTKTLAFNFISCYKASSENSSSMKLQTVTTVVILYISFSKATL